MWQQKLAASGVATFQWQNEDDSRPLEPTSTSEEDAKTFHNPALAAIRASQQLQELATKGDLNGSDDRVQASIHALHELAAETNRRFKQENASESSTPERPTTTHVQSKRRISEVSDVEPQPIGTP